MGKNVNIFALILFILAICLYVCGWTIISVILLIYIVLSVLSGLTHRMLIRYNAILKDYDDSDSEAFNEYLETKYGTKLKNSYRRFKIILWIIAFVIFVCIATMLLCNQLVVNNAKGKTYAEIDSIRPCEFGLLLGTTPQARLTKVTNYFFIYRIDAAEHLYKAGKIKKLLISGDENSLDGVNEPECMRDSLVARGVPASAIILDGKGYRTICSVINANKVYG